MKAATHLNGLTSHRTLKRIDSYGWLEAEDQVAQEEPLEIKFRIGSDKEKSAGIVMRTPVHDDWLAVGFLYSEGILHDRRWINGIEGVSIEGKAQDNIVTVNIDPRNGSFDPDYRERFVNSSCGICGKSTINGIFLRMGKIKRDNIKIDPGVIVSLPVIMKGMQQLFSKTGGIHAAALFSADGKPIVTAEDIGRHNAVDKVVGFSLIEGIDTSTLILQVSGRAGFEIVEKAAIAGIPVICSVSAPSSLAIEVCESLGLTLICFVRGSSFNVYTHAERIMI
ncbi:formate dehydrogenase [Thermoplasma volcanium GSS1]|uniref:Sulfur carrier protein FdhD n=1 Tax=Thermoplasma volcanium (strain ATCC 51530 / DSM 4299 / JCM 9571 / NBRC 15438 / GSS1) TaxID=273116 RepID=FDHD_THEVO|nr:formate dehydrogenase accessory sulfurtransferase FdhD [Thermoplasma volcanium]Q97C60.1 RecName: Full=Sulfur carrier protein FdhD [Thermoplasma volcanium GSS1]BAB59387.1 formate dehydrogenase [Thermoplasma volcanium GSS1]